MPHSEKKKKKKKEEEREIKPVVHNVELQMVNGGLRKEHHGLKFVHVGPSHERDKESRKHESVREE